jgi:hypothetical protein
MSGQSPPVFESHEIRGALDDFSEGYLG